jgi:addiction module RelB/DinJ family antitoxin
MEKTATLNLRVNPIAKQRAENVLKQLGIPMSTAMDMYLNQIALVGGIPFPVTLPKAPLSVDADRMTDNELIEKLSRGIEDADAGRTRRAEDVFHEHRSRRAE